MVAAALGTIGRERRGPRGAAPKNAHVPASSWRPAHPLLIGEYPPAAQRAIEPAVREQTVAADLRERVFRHHMLVCDARTVG
jgi:hypothetical protein